MANTWLGRSSDRLKPVAHPTAGDMAWAAGIYEGEGNCDGASRPTQHVNVSQKGRWLPDRLCALFGGKVGRLSVGTRYEQYRWYVTGARARGFLMTVYGLLSPRRQAQARCALFGAPDGGPRPPASEEA